MAFGFSPKHEWEINLDGFSAQEFLVLAIETIKKLEWNLSHISKNGLLAYTKFSFTSYGEEVKIIIEENVIKLKSECTGNQMLDYGKNKENIHDFISTYNIIKTTFTKEELATKYIDLEKSFVPEEENILSSTPLGTKSKITNFFYIFVPRKEYFITPILINLNIAVFILMVISGVDAFLPSSEDLLKWGANFRPVTLDYGWWRLLTCCFLHIGVFHLLMNMYALLYIGVLLEPILGRARFLSAYIVTGLAASLTSLGWHELTISAGASGAIFGMYGVFLAMLTTHLIEKSARQSMLISIGIFVGYNLLNGLKGGIDNAAHIGGLISGMLVGYIFYPNLKDIESQISKKASIIIISVCVLTASLIVSSSINNYIPIYDEKIKEFVALEEEALKVYNLPDTTSKTIILRLIKDPGISNWKKSIQIFEDMDKLNLPEPLEQRNVLLKYYCRLRVESYRKMYDLLKDSVKNYKTQSELEIINGKIENTIEKLGAQSQ